MHLLLSGYALGFSFIDNSTEQSQRAQKESPSTSSGQHDSIQGECFCWYSSFVNIYRQLTLGLQKWLNISTAQER